MIQLKRQREGFSLITAIVVIVIMASVTLLVMSMSGKIVKETTGQFRKEQAVLLAKSYTEYAILAVMGNDRSTNCLRDIDANDVLANSSEGKGYRVRVRLSYIGSNVDNCAATRIFSNAVVTPESNLNIIVDVYVEYKELDNTGADWITYHRRTLQKI